MEKIQIRRTKKENKTELAPMRFTKKEKDFLTELSKELKFKSLRDMIVFNAEVVKKLFEMNPSGKFFFKGNSKKSNEYDGIEIEFLP